MRALPVAPTLPIRCPVRDAVADAQPRRVLQVRVPVVALRALAADDHDVAVEDRVVAGAHDAPAAGGDERRPAGGVDVEALVRAPAVAPDAERADRRRGRRAGRGSDSVWLRSVNAPPRRTRPSAPRMRTR